MSSAWARRCRARRASPFRKEGFKESDISITGYRSNPDAAERVLTRQINEVIREIHCGPDPESRAGRVTGWIPEFTAMVAVRLD
jgi:hypothetical protein